MDRIDTYIIGSNYSSHISGPSACGTEFQTGVAFTKASAEKIRWLGISMSSFCFAPTEW